MKRIITVVFITTILSGCQKFVEIDLPENQILSEVVFNNDETAVAAMVNIYAEMISRNDLSYKFSCYNGLYADELKTYSTFEGLQQLYENSLNSKDAFTNDLWAQMYSFIYQANAIIEGCQASSRLSDPLKRQLIGEALFIRALWHFYLTNLYGSIPIVTSTDYKVNNSAKRDTSFKVYEAIVKDLKMSIEQLSEGYVMGVSVTEGGERIRANKYAAMALLAKVYLFSGDYAKCEEQSSLILGNTTVYDTVSLDNIFLKNSKEAILQLSLPISGAVSYNTPEGTFYALTSRPSTLITNSNVISPDLLNAFESGDKRKSKWIKSFTDNSVVPAEVLYYPFKYKIAASSSITEYSMLIRIAEVYLLRAEARVRLGDLSGAVKDVDVIRTRAGLGSVTQIIPSLNAENLVKALLHERQVELFLEWGHRWIDIRRSVNRDNIMTKVLENKGGEWGRYKRNWPIPLNDIGNNTNLLQNEGYN